MDTTLVCEQSLCMWAQAPCVHSCSLILSCSNIGKCDELQGKQTVKKNLKVPSLSVQYGKEQNETAKKVFNLVTKL